MLGATVVASWRITVCASRVWSSVSVISEIYLKQNNQLQTNSQANSNARKTVSCNAQNTATSELVGVYLSNNK